MAMTDSKAFDELSGGDYSAEFLDEPSTYRPEKGDEDPGLSSTVAAGTDEEVLLDGGPHDGEGRMTTTGGTAGPNSFKPHARHGQGIAPTTTGDATTGSMEPDDTID
jgi:hypothetical protein